MPDKKSDKPREIKFWIGLENAIIEWAAKEGIPFTTAVNHLCDRGLHQTSYKFPFHKPKYMPVAEEIEANDGKENHT